MSKYMYGGAIIKFYMVLEYYFYILLFHLTTSSFLNLQLNFVISPNYSNSGNSFNSNISRDAPPPVDI